MAVACSFGTYVPNAYAETAKTIPKSTLDRLDIKQITTSPIDGVSEFQLKKNGLKILLSQRPGTAVAVVMVVFNVGSRNEAVGYTGATHFLEHMMFKGTSKHDPLRGTGIDDLLRPIGGYNNATTSYDRTNYFDMVPAERLDTCIEFEADRMRHLSLRKLDRDTEMTVVRNELERNQDDPNELLETNLFATAFLEHPYHHPTIGWRSDVENVPLSRLKRFYDDFYWPNNATVVVTGKFDPGEALESIAKHFSRIAHSPNAIPAVYTSEPPQEGERRFTVKHGSSQPRVIIGFHVPEALSKDTFALDVLEEVLGNENKRASRLYKALIDTGLASETAAQNMSMRDPGLFVVTATGKKADALPQIEERIKKELSRLATEPVETAELARAEQSIVKREKISEADPLMFATLLCEAEAQGDWRLFAKQENEILKVQSNDVTAAAAKYFALPTANIGIYLPAVSPAEVEETVKLPNSVEDENTEACQPTSPPIVAKPEGKAANLISNNKKPLMGYSLSKLATTIKLQNGLQLVLLPIKGTGTISISGRVKAGEYWAENELIAPLVADLLLKGSEKLSRDEIAIRLSEMGSTLDFNSDNFFLNFNTEIVSSDLSRMLSTLSQVLGQPQFPERELAITKEVKKSELKDLLADTNALALGALSRTIYKPACVYYEQPIPKLIKQLDEITRDQIIRFKQKQLTPSNTVLVLAGDFNSQEAIADCQKLFSDWTGPGSDAVTIDPSSVKTIASYGKTPFILSPVPEKENVSAWIGLPIAVSKRSPDFFPTEVGNAAFGYSSFACRLAPLRNDLGLTYSVSSQITDEVYPYSTWAVNFSSNPKNVASTLRALFKIGNDYQTSGITLNELAVEKTHLAGVYKVQLRALKSLAEAIADAYASGVGLSFIDNFEASINQVTVPQANKAIREHLRLDKAVTSISGTISAPELHAILQSIPLSPTQPKAHRLPVGTSSH